MMIERIKRRYKEKRPVALEIWDKHDYSDDRVTKRIFKDYTIPFMMCYNYAKFMGLEVYITDARIPESYVVEKGDTLTKIAFRFTEGWGDWQDIYYANYDNIEDPDLITPGQVLLLPWQARSIPYVDWKRMNGGHA